MRSASKRSLSRCAACTRSRGPRVTHTPLEQVVTRSVTPLRVLMSDAGAMETDMSSMDFDSEEGEDITEQLSELVANDPAEKGKGEVEAALSPVQPYVNEKALAEATAKWKRHDNDCGSAQVRDAVGKGKWRGADARPSGSRPPPAQVQVARLSERISYLTAHLNKNKKDKSTERGLVLLANRRRKLLKYLLNEDLPTFERLTSEYGIRTKKIVQESLGVTRREKSRTGGAK